MIQSLLIANRCDIIDRAAGTSLGKSLFSAVAALLLSAQTPVVPAPYSPDASEEEKDWQTKRNEKFEISVRSFFTILTHPSQTWRGVVGMADVSRLLFVKSYGGVEVLTGPQMEAFLLSIFNPEEKMVIRYGEPTFMVETVYGRFTRKISFQEDGKREECITIYGDAVHDIRKGWRFVQLTFLFGDRFAPCRIKEP